jgi:hypothetical protein
MTETYARDPVFRRCPFCAELIQDEAGKNINLVVHMGKWTPQHTAKREWADYIQAINFRVF